MLEKVKSGIGRVGGVAIGIAVIEVIYISIYINKRCTVMFVGEKNFRGIFWSSISIHCFINLSNFINI